MRETEMVSERIQHVCVYTHVCVHMRVCTHVCVYTRVCVHMCECTGGVCLDMPRYMCL